MRHSKIIITTSLLVLIATFMNIMFYTASAKEINFQQYRINSSPRCTFTDVPIEHPYCKYIDEAVYRHLIVGYNDENNTFRGEDYMTHEEFLTFFMRLGLRFHEDYIPVEENYSIIDDASDENYWTHRWQPWAQQYLNGALDIGIIDTNDSYFAEQNKPITIREILHLLINYDVNNSNVKAVLIPQIFHILDEDTLSSYVTNWDTLSDTEKEYMTLAYSSTIIEQHETPINLNDYVTRQEAVKAIIRYLFVEDLSDEWVDENSAFWQTHEINVDTLVK